MRILLPAVLLLFQVLSWASSALGQSSSASTVPAASSAGDAELSELRERAAAFWAARVTWDPEAQWKLLEPRGKAKMTAQEYAVVPTGGRYLAYKVEDAAVNGFFATVKVRLLVQPIVPMEGAGGRRLPLQTVVVDDGWVRIRGVWYRRLDDVPHLPSGPNAQ